MRILRLLCVIAVPLVCTIVAVEGGEFITPEVTGSADTDSVVVTITVTDTTLLPTIADPDSLYILRFAPDQSLIDSIRLGAANLFKLRTGWYEAHFQAASADTQLGIYSVYASAFIGGDWRGHVAGCYVVKDETIHTLATRADSLLYLVELASYVLGTCDDCIKVYSPNDGTAYKDGYEVWVNGQKKVSIYFGHSNDASVLDTMQTTKEY